LNAVVASAAEREPTGPLPNWVTMPVPGLWEEQHDGKLAAYDGYAWYRAAVKIPAAWQGADLSLFVERFDNVHEAYFNGVALGGAGKFPPHYESGLEIANRYAVKADLVRPGETNLIALRVFDHDGRAGFKGTAPALFNERLVINLQGQWQFRTGDNAAWAKLPEKVDLAEFGPAVFATVDKAANILPRFTTVMKESGGLGSAEALARFRVTKDLLWEQVLDEPEIRQPLQMSFDERGRMWVVQYIQYPHPAGLKMISRDNFWRAVYDKVPVAPPNHVRGKDKITIHEDTDGDGRYDKHKTFVEGLNITTAVARGRGGVWVLNPPYLLFYPDLNNDDIPDTDPIVHLAGFGIEDTHSVTNSLRFGPDGWLYATQGSTVSAAIVRPGLDDKQPVHSMGQLVWRYHPETRKYEIFAEGGGNAFGLEMDSQGRIFSGHNGGDTRGFYYTQGAYLQKGFGKHGPLSNPFAFGYFPAMGHHKAARFTHTFLIYEGGALPAPYDGGLFGCEPLQNQIVLAEIERDGSTFKTKDLSRPVATEDTWFRPVDIKTGPDGAVYVADWYDGQVNHYRNHEGRIDPEIGRIYRLKSPAAKPLGSFDLSRKSSRELVEVLKHENKWYRETALRLLGDRRDTSLIPTLKTELAKNEPGQFALECLWALNLCGGLDERAATGLLAHAEAGVRLWTVRLMADDGEVGAELATKIAQLARDAREVDVRAQLAASARRLPAEAALPIIFALLKHDEDLTDPQMPLLDWWAIEAQCTRQPEAVLEAFASADLWQLPLVREVLLDRLMRRFALASGRANLLRCARLLELAPDEPSSKILLAGFETAFKGRSLAGLPDELVAAMSRFGGGSLSLSLRRGDERALRDSLELIAQPASNVAEAQQQLQLVQILGEIKPAGAVGPLLLVLQSAKNEPLRQGILAALQPFDDREIPAAVLALYGQLSGETLLAAQTLLTSRPESAEQLLQAVAAGKIDAASIPPAIVRKLMLHGEKISAPLIAKYWHGIGGATTGEMQAEIVRLRKVIESGYGSPYRGKLLFTQNCGKCHKLFGEGGQIGPDLTPYKRDDLGTMLLNVVNPSAEIREGFENFVLLTDDGRVLNGFLADQDNQVVSLRTAEGQTVTLARDEIEAIEPAGRSVMPEGALKAFSPEQIRDLFAYLRASQPLND
jgi:putative heme-binding domain-containing protein